ncbi:hypothetical protein BGZ94_006016, partial [Podila epigama]
TTSIFEAIQAHEDFKEKNMSVRVIMIYSRSDVLPTVPDPMVLKDLRSHENPFFFDCIYLHKKHNEVPGEIKPQHIYDRLTEIEDIDSIGYCFELCKMVRKYCQAMAELLAHPKVRLLQDEFDAIIPPLPLTDEDEPLATRPERSGGTPPIPSSQPPVTRIGSPFTLTKESSSSQLLEQKPHMQQWIHQQQQQHQEYIQQQQHQQKRHQQQSPSRTKTDSEASFANN